MGAGAAQEVGEKEPAFFAGLLTKLGPRMRLPLYLFALLLPFSLFAVEAPPAPAKAPPKVAGAPRAFGPPLATQ
jgi:hypothetical protein